MKFRGWFTAWLRAVKGDELWEAISALRARPRIVMVRARVFIRKGMGATDSLVRRGNKAHPASPAPSARRFKGFVKVRYSSDTGVREGTVPD